jgi:multiple sugar transport system permease protein
MPLDGWALLFLPTVLAMVGLAAGAAAWLAGLERTVKGAVMVLLALWAVACCFPLGWMAFTSLVSSDQIKTGGITLVGSPAELTLDNYRVLFSRAGIVRWFVNSLAVAGVITLFHLLFDAMAGWAFARMEFPGKRVLFAVVVATMMVPGQIVTVPLFIQMSGLGLIDSLWALILPALAGPFGIFLFRTHCQSLPRDLEEAARIDGCSDWGIFSRIVLPLSLPVLGTLGTFLFVTHWNAFMWPLVVLFSASRYTLPVGLATLQGQHDTDYGLLMAGASVSALPMVAVFLGFHRLFVQEITAGALKG